MQVVYFTLCRVVARPESELAEEFPRRLAVVLPCILQNPTELPYNYHHHGLPQPRFPQ